MKAPPMDPCTCSNAGCSNYLEINRKIIERTALYSELRDWRTSQVSIVNEAGKKAPAYVFATDRTLRDLVHYRPSNEDELLNMYGVGKEKVKKFGLEILEIINGSDAPEHDLVRFCEDCSGEHGISNDPLQWIATGSPNPARDPKVSPSGSACCPTCGRDWDGIRRVVSTGSTVPSGLDRPEIITNEILDPTPEQRRAIPKSSRNVLQIEIQAKSLESIFHAIDAYVKQPTVGKVFDHDDFAASFTVKPEWVTVRAGGVGYFRQRLAHTISPRGQ